MSLNAFNEFSRVKKPTNILKKQGFFHNVLRYMFGRISKLYCPIRTLPRSNLSIR